MTDTNEALSGEQRLESRTRRLWTFCALGMAATIAIGLGSGYAAALYEEGALPGWLIVVLWGLALVSFTWFTWGYFRRVDELDVMDNLWAGMIGLYFYCVGLPTWLAFAHIGIAPPMDDVLLYVAVAVVTGIAYGLRKLGLR
ncbi:hypothetical protein [Aurantiacibacter hainanensis]|uniref:hypothetical protein n=1 Tax=Aurantiacibacter hainanensis TaxID=3076114 RepID=UPI0030C6DD40